jgi:hypothetical protein
VGHEPIVQTELERAVLDLRESNVFQHLFQLYDRYSRLMLIESQFIVYELDPSQNLKNRIHKGTRPRHDKRPARPQQAVRFGQDFFGLRQVFQDGKHRDVIELAAVQRQYTRDVRGNH